MLPCLFILFIYLLEIKVDYSLEWFGDIVVSVYQILNIFSLSPTAIQPRVGLGLLQEFPPSLPV
jgi:hypothetical protein